MYPISDSLLSVHHVENAELIARARRPQRRMWPVPHRARVIYASLLRSAYVRARAATLASSLST